MAVGQGTRAEPAATDSGGGGETQSQPQSSEKEENAVDVSCGGGESEVAELRRRWELASVLNFLTVRSLVSLLSWPFPFVLLFVAFWFVLVRVFERKRERM